MDIPHRSIKPLKECGDCAAAAPMADGNNGYGMGDAVIGGADRWDLPFATSPAVTERRRRKRIVRKKRR